MLLTTQMQVRQKSRRLMIEAVECLWQSGRQAAIISQNWDSLKAQMTWLASSLPSSSSTFLSIANRLEEDSSVILVPLSLSTICSDCPMSSNMMSFLGFWLSPFKKPAKQLWTSLRSGTPQGLPPLPKGLDPRKSGLSLLEKLLPIQLTSILFPSPTFGSRQQDLQTQFGGKDPPPRA